MGEHKVRPYKLDLCPYFYREPVMQVMCSWCRESIKEKEPLWDKSISYGICNECYEMNEVKEFKEREEKECKY